MTAKEVKRAILASWEQYGAEALRRVAEEAPALYLALVARLLPRDQPTTEVITVTPDFRDAVQAEQEAFILRMANELRSVPEEYRSRTVKDWLALIDVCEETRKELRSDERSHLAIRPDPLVIESRLNAG